VYGATWVSGPLPVFADAVVITEFQGTTFAHATNPATTWHLWIKWVSVDGVESTTPAGGINGLSVTTGQDVSKLLTALDGELTATQLHTSLGTRIDLIDGASSVAGSVNARILTEANSRIDAVNYEARTRNDQVQSNAEALLRNVLAVDSAAAQATTNIALAKSELTTDFQAGIAAEATARLTLDARLATEKTQTLALISDEATARATAVSAEATARSLLATQVLGADGTSLTQGLIYDERTTRSTETTSLAQQITLLSAGAGEQFDWQSIWYFDTGVESWSGNGTPTATAGWLRAADQASGAYVNSPAGIAADGAKYGQIRLRIRKTGSPTFAGWLYWQGTLDSTWDVLRRVALTEPTYDVNNIGLITVTPAWGAITLDKIRVDLSSAQAVGSCFEIDWVAVGRPSPGASSAQLYTEQTTRATADTANASAISTLSAQVNHVTTGLPATVALLATEQTTRADADAAEAALRVALAARVTTAEGNITATAANLTTEQTTRANADTANASDITTLSAQVNNVSTGLPQTRADLITTQNTLATATAASAADIRSLRVQSQQIDETALRNVLTTDANRTEFIGTLALASQELRTDMEIGISAEASARLALAAIVATNEATTSAAITDEQTARATAISAEANARLALAAVVTTNASVAAAAISDEQTTRATEDSALATRATALEASVTGLTGDVATRATISYVDTAKADAISASASSIATVQAQLNTGGSTAVAIATAQTTANTAVTASSANASSISTVQARLDSGDFAAVKVESSASASSVTGLLAQYTVKLDVNGKVSGYGLASTGPTGTGSAFEVRADKFIIAAETGAAAGNIPFTVLTAPATIGGVNFSAGVYATQAFILDAQITNAKIQNLAVDDAKIANLGVSKLTAGALSVGAYVRSTTYTSGSAGFTINADGFAEFNNIVVRGVVYASSGSFSGALYATSGYVQGLEIRNGAGQVILNSGNTSTQIFNSNVTLGIDSATGRMSLDGAGGGSVNGVIMPGYQINSGNVGTYIANATIGTAHIADLSVNTLKIAGNAVTFTSAGALSALTGNGGWQTLGGVIIYNDVSGANALVTFAASCAYSSGVKTTQYILEWWIWNGSSFSHYANIYDSGPITGAYVPMPTGSGIASGMGTGNHLFRLQWYGQDTAVGIVSGNMVSMGVKK